MANHRSGDGWASPERTMVWTEPKHKHKQVVGVVYYLCRRQDGQLDHPHFVHVPCLSDSDSDPPRLHLRDVIARLSELRGAAMPAAYSWSAKRTYRNAGYVWQDLTADDLILPASNHHEYVLFPLLLADSTTAAARKQNKHKRWTSLDLGDYHHRSDPAPAPAPAQLIGIDEISSPPPSSSSPDTVDVASASAAVTPQGLIIGGGGGRMRASAILMQLISCGGSSMKELQDGQGQPQRSLPPPSDDSHNNKPDMDQRDYFSGSLVETNSSKTTSDRIELSLRRSSSCNADRGASSRLGVVDGKSTAARRNMDRRQIRS